MECVQCDEGANMDVVASTAPTNYAGIYVRRIVNIPKTDPWYGLAYFGQVNRGNCMSVDDAVHKRWKEEERQAIHDDKDIGLIAAISMYGPGALKNEILYRNEGSDRQALQRWADALEKKCIRDNGGPFRDDGSMCTLNLTHGGKGGVNFESMDALRTVKWKRFASELLSYVESSRTALVNSRYVASSKYRLGKQVVQVRTGQLWRGHPDEAARVAWLEALPGWVWKALDSPEHISKIAQTTKNQYSSASDEILASWNSAKSTGHSTPAAVQASSSRAREEWESGTGFGSASSKAASTAARSTDEFREALSCTRKAAAAAKHAAAMEHMTDQEKARYQLKVANKRRHNSSRERALAVLRKIPGWENSGLNHLAKARELGVIPNLNKVGNFVNSYESQKAALAELKKIPGWENSMHKDIARARKLGLISDGRKRKRVLDEDEM